VAKALAPPSKLDEESGATVNELRREFISTYVSLYGEPCFCVSVHRRGRFLGGLALGLLGLF